MLYAVSCMSLVACNTEIGRNNDHHCKAKTQIRDTAVDYG
jgi:predicted small secreted protein